MIPVSRPQDYAPEIRALSPDFMDWPFIDKHISALPDRFKGPVISRYSNKRKNEGQQAANLYLLGKQAVTKQTLTLAASDAEICNFAKERADYIRNKLAETTGIKSAELMRGWLLDYAQQYGCQFPVKVTLSGIVARMTLPKWWRGQLRKSIAREIEANAIDLGLVHRRAGLYASDETCERHRGQIARNKKALENTEATNEEGFTATLAELSEVGVSNPRIRRMELMTRIAGFEAFAKEAGHVGMFYTVTTPSRMHARLSVSGQENQKYDGTTPRQAAQYLSKTWAKARSWLDRRDIKIYGFRVSEPHHDGTPHWHMLFFMVPQAVESVTACIRKYFSEADAHELKTEAAAKARFEQVRIDWSRGSAAGYISKYIAKNIDGERNDASAAGDDFEAAEPTSAKETAPRVLAWASTWRIRQFQQIGGPGVTVWRELRRIRDMKQGDLFDTWSAADAGNWQLFTERQGGATCKKADRPVQLWSEQLPGKKNCYGEDAAPEVCGVDLGGVKYETRKHIWTIKRIPRADGYSANTETAIEDKAAGKSREASRLGFSGLTLAASPPWSEQLPGKKNCYGEESAPEVCGVDLGGVKYETRKHVWTIRKGGNVKKEKINMCFMSPQMGIEVWRVVVPEVHRGGVLNLAASPPWSPVNNCTGEAEKIDADGFAIGSFSDQPAPPPLSATAEAEIRQAQRAAVMANINSKRKRGAFGRFPTLERGGNERSTEVNRTGEEVSQVSAGGFRAWAEGIIGSIG